MEKKFRNIDFEEGEVLKSMDYSLIDEVEIDAPIKRKVSFNTDQNLLSPSPLRLNHKLERPEIEIDELGESIKNLDKFEQIKRIKLAEFNKRIAERQS